MYIKYAPLDAWLGVRTFLPHCRQNQPRNLPEGVLKFARGGAIMRVVYYSVYHSVYQVTSGTAVPGML